MDRSYAKMQTVEEADDQLNYWLSKSPKERLSAAWYLICSAYNIEYRNDHRLDRTLATTRKHKL